MATSQVIAGPKAASGAGPAFVREPEATDRRSLIYGVAFFGALIGLPFYAVPHLTFSSTTTDVAFGLVAYAALRLSILMARGAAALMECAFWTFTYSFLTLPMLAQMTAGKYVLATPYSYNTKTFARAQLFIMVGLAGYEIGHLLWNRRRRAGGRSAHRDDSQSRSSVGEISIRRATIVGYIGLAFVALAVARYGLGNFFTSRDALTQSFLGRAPIGQKFYLSASKAGGSSLLALTQVPVFIGAYMLLYVRRNGHAVESKLPSWWLIAPLLVGNVIVNNPIGNARYWFGTVLIAFVSIYLPLRRRRWAVRLFVFLFVVVSLFSFQQLAAFRRTGGANFSGESIQVSLVAEPDYASPQQLMSGLLWVDDHGYRLGRQLLGSLFVWVPRSAWPGKAGGTGVLVGGDAAGFNVSAPLWTEGQVDFGLPGTFLYLLMLGLIAVRLDAAYRAVQSHAKTILVALTPILASLIVFVVRGSLQPAFGSLIAVLGSVALCAVYRGRRSAGRYSPDAALRRNTNSLGFAGPGSASPVNLSKRAAAAERPK